MEPAKCTRCGELATVVCFFYEKNIVDRWIFVDVFQCNECAKLADPVWKQESIETYWTEKAERELRDRRSL